MSPAEVVKLQISPHAASRFVQRRGASSATRAEVELLQMAAEGKEVQPPAEWIFRNGLRTRHGGEENARYIRSGGWLLVVRETDYRLVVATVYRPDTWWW